VVAVVNEETGSATVLLVGVLLIRLSLTNLHVRYVQESMGVWLLASGIVLTAVGAAGVVRALLRPHATVTVADHHEGHTERIGWLLLAPVVALLMVSPPPLGSYGVDRSTVVIDDSGTTFAPLPPSETVTMTLLEFDQRAADHDGASFGTTPVQLTGFVARTEDGAGFVIARYQIACCAADAVAAVARIVGTSGDAPSRDSWVSVTGTYHGLVDGVPELRATSLQLIQAPVDPYE
jgi:uncharacterized repeat protein (TIGR03943 family)